MENIYTRQLQFLHPQAWDDRTVHIIGCGGLGSPIALILAKMGAQKINLYDLDTVEVENINNQLFGLKDIGQTKVEAVKNNIEMLSGIRLSDIRTFHGDILKNTNFKPLNSDIVILSLDSNDVRRRIYKQLMENSFFGLIIDPRMAGLVFSVYASVGTKALKYEDWTPVDDKVREDVCTAKAIAFNTFGCASVASGIIRKYLNDEFSGQEFVQMDMLNNFITPILK